MDQKQSRQPPAPPLFPGSHPVPGLNILTMPLGGGEGCKNKKNNNRQIDLQDHASCPECRADIEARLRRRTTSLDKASKNTNRSMVVPTNIIHSYWFVRVQPFNKTTSNSLSSYLACRSCEIMNPKPATSSVMFCCCGVHHFSRRGSSTQRRRSTR